MVSTLDALLAFLSSPAGLAAGGVEGSAAEAAAAAASPAKVVVWAHNSHVGDARATEMGAGGELNIGQLCRQRYGGEGVFILGFSTYTGSVTAAPHWDGPAERMRVRPGLEGSYEALFHAVGLPRFLLDLRRRGSPAVAALAAQPRLHRAIGVVYKPRSERRSHYFDSTLPQQYDAIIHVDETRAVEPLERSARWEAGRGEEETYPFGY
jgi:erythromycin esterase-like protein